MNDWDTDPCRLHFPGFQLSSANRKLGGKREETEYLPRLCLGRCLQQWLCLLLAFCSAGWASVVPAFLASGPWDSCVHSWWLWFSVLQISGLPHWQLFDCLIVLLLRNQISFIISPSFEIYNTKAHKNKGIKKGEEFEYEMKSKEKQMFSPRKEYRNGLLRTTFAKTLKTNVRLHQNY